MKYAKSMYLGGQYLSASDCDYESARLYGLVCPVCQSAVFLRAGTKRLNTLRNGIKKWQYPDACFCHYQTGVEDIDCELRSPTQFSNQVRQLALIEAKNQRLKLYNKHLITMFIEDHNAYKFKQNFQDKAWRRVITDSWKARFMRRLRLFINSDPEIKMLLLNPEIIEDLATAPSTRLADYGKVTKQIGYTEQDMLSVSQMWLDYIQKHNLNLHQAIAGEIIEFALTLTGGYFLSFLVDVGVFYFCLQNKFSIHEARHLIEPMDVCLAGVGQINSTRWLNIIPKYLAELPEFQ